MISAEEAERLYYEAYGKALIDCMDRDYGRPVVQQEIRRKAWEALLVHVRADFYLEQRKAEGAAA